NGTSCWSAGFEHLLDAAEGLAGAFFVFDEGEADEGVAGVAEADAGADGGFGVDEELLGEVERAHGAELFGDFGPDEHGGLGHFDVPAELVEALDEDIAAGLVICNDFRDTFLRAVERGDGGDLDGGEGAVVEVALDAAERGDQLLVADLEANAPAGHIVGLGEREELDGDVLGARDFEDGGGAVAVEDQVGIGEVVDDVDAEFLAQRHQALEEGEIDALGGGVGGEVEDEQLGAGVHARQFALEGGEESG